MPPVPDAASATVLTPLPRSAARVCAVVLAPAGGRNPRRGLDAVLAAVAAQTIRPDRIIVLDQGVGGDRGFGESGDAPVEAAPTNESAPTEPAGNDAAAASEAPPQVDQASPAAQSAAGDLPHDETGQSAYPADPATAPPSPPQHVEVRPAPGPSLRAGVRAVADDLDPGWLVWVLMSGSIPAPDALARLVDAHRRSPSVGVSAPKLLDASDPSLLRSVGISATRTGRIIDDPADNAADQGQFDHRHDVLAAPALGSLVEASLVRELRGWEPAFGDVAADLDFGWRAQRRGRRVLLVPTARVHVPAGTGLATATTGQRRRAGRQVALARATWWGAILLAVWLVVSSVLSAVALLLVKRPRAAWESLSELGALAPIGIPTAWWRTRGPSTVRRRDLAGLFVSGATIRARLADHIHEALVPGRSDLEESPAEQRRSTASRVARHPGLLATLAVMVAYAVAGRSLGGTFLTGIGGGPVGGELLGGRISSAALWHAWVDPWRGAGLGSTAVSGGPHLGLLAVPTWIVEHTPGVSSVSSPGGLVIGLLLLAGPALATISAYAAGRVLTGRPWPRAVAALIWAMAGPAPTVYAEGRLGAVMAHVLLPAVGAGLVLLTRADGTATAAWATALAAGVLGAFAPIYLPLVALLALGVVIAAPTRAVRVRALVPLLVPATLLGPWLAVLGHEPGRLLGGPGGVSWGAPQATRWDLLFLQPHPVPSGHWWLAVPGVVLGVLALPGLARSGGWRSLGTGLVAALVLAAGLSVAVPRLVVATAPAAPSTSGGASAAASSATSLTLTPWVGLPLLFLEMILLAAALWGLDGLPAPSRWLRRGALGVLGSAAALAAATLAATTLGTALSPWSDPQPAVAVEHAAGEVASRSLFLTPSNHGVSYRLVSRELTDVARGLPVDRRDDAALAPSVDALLAGTPGAGAALAAHAIGVVALVDSADPALTRALDAADSLTRLSPRAGWSFWRLAGAGPDGQRPVAPPRLGLHTGEVVQVVPTTGIHAATVTTLTAPPSATLVVAEPAGWAASADVRWNDEPLTAVPGAERPTYAVPAGTGELTVLLRDPWSRWRTPLLIWGLVVVFLAVPFGSRASRRKP